MDTRQHYEADLANAQAKTAILTQHLVRLVWTRTGLFFGAVVCLVLAFMGDVGTPGTTWLGWSLAAVFLVAIVWNEHVRLAREAALSDEQLAKRLLARLDRRWEDVPAQNFLAEVTPPMCSDDLDVAGESSVLSLLSLAGTHPGQKTLQTWVAETPDWKIIQRRQAAVQALKPARPLRLEVIRKVSEVNYQSVKPYDLTAWAQSPSWLKRHPVANVASYVGPCILLLGAIGLVVGIFFRASLGENARWFANAGFVCLAVGVVINLLVTILWGGWIHGIFQQVCGQHQAARKFTEVFRLISNVPADGGLLDEIRTVCSQPPTSALDGFGSLNLLVRLASFQHSPVLYLVYLALQITSLWDLHVLRWMESWKKKFGSSVAGWFDALGQCEALISAATLADENPSWAYPTPNDDASVLLDAKQLAHPLLPDASRVANDVLLSRDHPLILVTGSNMAGKSTFLRSIGVNVLLARTGSPVCARRLSMPVYEIASSIRVRDSLREGVSFFMAELLRLKNVVDLAVEHQRNTSLPPILFLLDEILQGTNSRERKIAVAQVVEQLVRFQACGLLSTHDLDLAEVPDVADVAQIVHFREMFVKDAEGKEVMRFDYVMRPGVTPTTNALKLLELVGLKGEATKVER